MDAAGNEAAKRGHNFLSSTHVLLALTREESVAGEALRACGATYEAIEQVLADDWQERREPSPDGILSGADFHELEGFARGFAAGRRESPNTDHLLAALLWDPQKAWPLHRAGVDRAAVAEALERLGGPKVELPPEPNPRNWGDTVFFPYAQLGDVLRALATRAPGRYRWNTDGRYRAWAEADVDVPLSEIVDEVLGR